MEGSVLSGFFSGASPLPYSLSGTGRALRQGGCTRRPSVSSPPPGLPAPSGPTRRRSSLAPRFASLGVRDGEHRELTQERRIGTVGQGSVEIRPSGERNQTIRRTLNNGMGIHSRTRCPSHPDTSRAKRWVDERRCRMGVTGGGELTDGQGVQPPLASGTTGAQRQLSSRAAPDKKRARKHPFGGVSGEGVEGGHLIESIGREGSGHHAFAIPAALGGVKRRLSRRNVLRRYSSLYQVPKSWKPSHRNGE